MATATDHAHHDHAGHGAHDTHHYDYVKIWALLCGLLVISIIGPMFGVLILTLITAFGIAFIKAYMVARYFMHVNVQQPVVHYFLVTALVFMVLFFAGTSPDVMRHDGQRWTNDAAKAEIERALAVQASAHGAHGSEHAAPEHGTPAPSHEGGGH